MDFNIGVYLREIDAIACAVYILEVLDNVENLKEIPYLEKIIQLFISYSW